MLTCSNKTGQNTTTSQDACRGRRKLTTASKRTLNNAAYQKHKAATDLTERANSGAVRRLA
jgi:hypothetical protein